MTKSLASCLVVLVVAACGGESDVPDAAWTALPETALAAPQQQQYADAVAARDELFQDLSGALTQALMEKSTAEAIDVCRDQAPAIARRVSETRGVRIGRTAHRLRNPGNVPPDWARPFVEERREETAIVSHTDGRLGVLTPIRLKLGCLQCHGEAASLDADVRAAIEAHYPEDEATGFEQGDLRGWFWVEVPAPQE